MVSLEEGSWLMNSSSAITHYERTTALTSGATNRIQHGRGSDRSYENTATVCWRARGGTVFAFRQLMIAASANIGFFY